MLDSWDWLFDSVALIFLFAIAATAIMLFVWLGSLPGSVARRRGHPYTDAITALGWLGLLFVFFWPVALTWAFTHPRGEGGTGP